VWKKNRYAESITYDESTVRYALFLLTFVYLLSAAALPADEWPQWRGPRRDGSWNETGILETFPPGGLKIRWRVPVGIGFSTPIVAQGRVFLTDSELVRPKGQERVHAFEESTGKPLWRFGYDADYPDWAFQEENRLGPRATPVVADGRLYTIGIFGQIFCFDVLKGNVVWKRDLRKDYPGKHIECTASPLLDDDRLILFCGAPAAAVMALDKQTGQTIWGALEETVTFSSPIIIKAGGTRQLIIWTQESVASLDPATGKTLWRERISTSGDFAVPTPVFHNNRLLIAGLMLKLDPDKPAASILWPRSRAVSARILSNTSTALFAGDYIYSAKSTGELVCLEASTGKQVWENDKVAKLQKAASIHLTPIGRSFLLFTDGGDLIRAQLAPSGYKELSRFHLLEPTYTLFGNKHAWAPPAFANGNVYARNDKELVSASMSASVP